MGVSRVTRCVTHAHTRPTRPHTHGHVHGLGSGRVPKPCARLRGLVPSFLVTRLVTRLVTSRVPSRVMGKCTLPRIFLKEKPIFSNPNPCHSIPEPPKCCITTLNMIYNYNNKSKHIYTHQTCIIITHMNSTQP